MFLPPLLRENPVTSLVLISNHEGWGPFIIRNGENNNNSSKNNLEKMRNPNLVGRPKDD